MFFEFLFLNDKGKDQDNDLLQLYGRAGSLLAAARCFLDVSAATRTEIKFTLTAIMDKAEGVIVMSE